MAKTCLTNSSISNTFFGLFNSSLSFSNSLILNLTSSMASSIPSSSAVLSNSSNSSLNSPSWASISSILFCIGDVEVLVLGLEISFSSSSFLSKSCLLLAFSSRFKNSILIFKLRSSAFRLLSSSWAGLSNLAFNSLMAAL